MKSNHGMSVVLRVIVTGVVLIMIAMTVVFIGTGGLRRVAGPKGEMSQQRQDEIAQNQCKQTLRQLCRNAPKRVVKVPTESGGTLGSYKYASPDNPGDKPAAWKYTSSTTGQQASSDCQNLLGLTANSWYLCRTGSYEIWGSGTFTPYK